MADVEIYALCCPDSGEVRYIGKANNSSARLERHICDMKRRDYPVYMWLRKLIANNKKPVLVIVETAPADAWQDAEKRIIAKHRESGRLLNIADGGDEPHCSKQQRAENGRNAAIARTSTPEKAKVQAMKHKGNSIVRWLKESGQWDGERGMRIRKAMQRLARADSRYQQWEVKCEL